MKCERSTVGAIVVPMATTRRTARQAVLAAVDTHGLEFDEYETWYGGLNGSVYAPAGVVFASTGCHTLTVAEDERAAGWRFLADELAQGFDACTEAECDTCGDR
jgi:hypothetical protein